ncbi:MULTISPECIES: hypothetical protein [Bacillus cereus group]|uniref:hypothetical protein n=1 Tax=Bacillus cereus group TaxID=86661 RepID=UPI0009B7177F|nr:MULTISPECIES: hypothetical protein [Bacillus cereus group]ARC27474.1 hypothetical protein A6J74_00110 [Bacillus sp. FDAARGOS_235]PEI61537.1 hypothetical protein CN642_14220 [Bacillus toyonensis]
MVTNKSNDSENELQPLDIDMIDTKSVSEGIKVTIEPYPDMQVGDRIEIYWDGHTHDYTIDEDEVNNAIGIEIPFADAKKIKNGSVPLYYRIPDRAGNTNPIE